MKFLSIFSTLLLAASTISASALELDYPFGDSDVSVVKTSFTNSCDKFGCRTAIQGLLAVKNKSFKKNVGVRYSTDYWKTIKEIVASYKEPVEDGYELWSFAETVFHQYRSESSNEVEFAGFASYNDGPLIWDPRNNFFLRDKPTFETPIAISQPNTKIDLRQPSPYPIRFKGRLQTYNPTTDSSAQGNIEVQWSTDGWKTVKVEKALRSREANVYKFEGVVGENSPALPESLQYRVKYVDTVGKTFELNNSNANYTLRIKPALAVDYAPFDAPVPSPTTVWFHYESSFNYYQPAEYRIDGGEWKQGISAALDKDVLGAGEHVIETRAELVPGSGVYVSEDTLKFSFAA
ncbi:hypothetical protein HDV05_007409 [Chytridiales sp. JEL 0842]|nr:hypothetical protein HDV05_007409 [Chytridiales sp. JEL 0842]